MIVSLIRSVYFLKLKAENTAVTLIWSWRKVIKCHNKRHLLVPKIDVALEKMPAIFENKTKLH